MKGHQTLVKFLIDECLTKKLEELATERLYVQSRHLKHLDRLGRKDFNLMRTILEDDWTLVTRNTRDFVPELGGLSTKPLYAGVEIHAGVVALNMPLGSRLNVHIEYFEAALDFIKYPLQLTNQIVEVNPDGVSGKLRVRQRTYPENGD